MLLGQAKNWLGSNHCKKPNCSTYSWLWSCQISKKNHRKAEQRFVSRCRKLLTTPMGKVRKKLCDQLLSVGLGSKKWFYFLEVCDILDERCVTLNFSIWKKVFYIVSWYFKPIFFECPWQERKIWTFFPYRSTGKKRTIQKKTFKLSL